MAVNTIGTVLKFGTESATLTKLCAIKSYPDMIGKPDNLDTTDLDSDQQTYIPGVKQIDSLDFTANYDWATFKTMQANANTDGFFELDFGTDGADGKFTWQGQYSVSLSGGDVNAVREMTITVMPSTEITPVTA